ncbi:hypothetical protein [Chryseobacterium sp.]|uniref:hypothetical protein n=1 Tax=Chryseobacterium sp. TaxID=1871047 RepID=UPI0028A2AEF9|nr:hypothetical protein [Chryseobacterium sp.]
MNIPSIDNEFFCISNIDSYILSAIVSSYINKTDVYTSMYEFSNVTDFEKEMSGNIIDKDQPSRNRAREFSLKIKNILQKINGCEYLILIGLTEEQKSYLSFTSEYNIIEIQDIKDIEFFLEPIITGKEKLSVKEEDVIRSLPYACYNNLVLQINDESSDFNLKIDKTSEVLIVIENYLRTSIVIAINYGVSIDAEIRIVPRPILNKSTVENLIEDWQNGIESAMYELKTSIYPSIEGVNFSEYKYLTFFTVHIPYSLITNNILPTTHVNLNLYPDLFIFNNIYFESNDTLRAGVVFSPEEFKDEETDLVINELNNKSLFVEKLIGKNATAINLDYLIKLFPYDLFHICSHGGEIDGYEISHNFIDRDGVSHTVQYDEVVTFSPEPGKELIKVTTKNFWRKLDGFNWGSTELKDQQYPHYVFEDMTNSSFENPDKKRINKNNVRGSSSIKCYDFHYQALFNILASGSNHPIIFNNTCNSWSRISDPFIRSGARFYIGTLWKIDNLIAKDVAEDFYKNLNKDPILNTFTDAQKHTVGNRNENIYLLWGLHFTTFRSDKTKDENQEFIIDRLLYSLFYWRTQKDKAADEPTKENIKEFIYWYAKYLASNFRDSVTERIKKSR